MGIAAIVGEGDVFVAMWWGEDIGVGIYLGVILIIALIRLLLKLSWMGTIVRMSFPVRTSSFEL